jgi:hypothetical protein
VIANKRHLTPQVSLPVAWVWRRLWLESGGVLPMVWSVLLSEPGNCDRFGACPQRDLWPYRGFNSYFHS